MSSKAGTLLLGIILDAHLRTGRRDLNVKINLLYIGLSLDINLSANCVVFKFLYCFINNTNTCIVFSMTLRLWFSQISLFS